MGENYLPKSVREIIEAAGAENASLFAAFPREKWTKYKAWNEIHQQDKGQIWRKCHTVTHWCWCAQIGDRWQKKSNQ